jgi:MoaE-MoaD fusion protein
MIRVLYFGLARDLAGVETEEVEIAAEIPVRDLWSVLIDRHPGLAGCRGISRVALDMTYASDESVVVDGAEVAVIPPVAGG